MGTSVRDKYCWQQVVVGPSGQRIDDSSWWWGACRDGNTNEQLAVSKSLPFRKVSVLVSYFSDLK